MPKNRSIKNVESAGIKDVVSDAEELIVHEKSVLGQLYTDVNKIWNILSLWGMLNNKKWRFIWKEVPDGYSCRATIMERKATRRERIVVYDVDSKASYRYLIGWAGDRLIEAMSEAVFYIIEETAHRKTKLEKYSAWIEQQNDVFKAIFKEIQGKE